MYFFVVILQQINVLDITHINVLQPVINTNPWRTKSNVHHIKLSLYRPREAPLGYRRLRLQVFLDSHHTKVARLSALCTGCLYSQEIPLIHVCVRAWGDPRAIGWSEESQWKIPMTPSGIESMTFQLVAKCLNQLQHHVPQSVSYMKIQFISHREYCSSFSQTNQ